MWFIGATFTAVGIVMVALGAVAAITSNDERARWALGRGTVVLVLGMVMFLGVPLTGGGGVDYASLASVVMVASAVGAFVVLMLGDDNMQTGRQMTSFKTRPARHVARKTKLEEKIEKQKSDRPLTAANRPAALHPALEHKDPEAV